MSRQYLDEPLVPRAKYRVDCTCGFATDHAGPSERAALDDVSARHRHAPGSAFALLVSDVDYTDHPLYRKERADAALKARTRPDPRPRA